MTIELYGEDSVKLFWDKAICEEGISHYRIYQDEKLKANTLDEKTEIIVDGLQLNVEYSFYVKGVTNNNRITEKSNTIKVLIRQDFKLNYYLNIYI